MKSLLLIGALFGTFFLLSYKPQGTEKVEQMPAEHIKETLLENLKKIQEHGEAFHASIPSGKTEIIRQKFLALRAEFKRSELLIAYIDPQLFNQSLNGAPLPKIMKKVPDMTIIEPQGLQRMEEVVFEDHINIKDLEELYQKFATAMKGLVIETGNRPVYDADIFEAIRFGIIRLNALGVTGFDSPGNTDKTFTECVNYLDGMEQALSTYYTYLDDPTALKLKNLIKKGISQLKSSDFESFDHLKFLKEFINPLWEQTLTAQRKLRIELPHHRTQIPLYINYEATNLFADDFLNAKAYADHIDERYIGKRIKLGKLLFFDPILSANNQRACASCHQPSKGFSDGLPTSLTTESRQPGLRNSPTIINSLYADRYFHDIRTDRLSLQMDHVVFNPDEFNTDYSEIANKLRQSKEYQQLFAEAYGRQGVTKNSITNAVASYVGSVRSFNSEFDRYVRGEIREIDPAIIRGYNLFQGKAGCATCHFAPTFSGNVPPDFKETETEVLGVPSTPKEPFELDKDLGRYLNGLIKEKAPFYKNSFKTPTLRNIELTGPYMHNGVYEKLEDVVDFYNKGGGIGLGLDVPHQTLPGDSLGLTKQEEKDIVTFMKSLTDTSNMTSIPTALPKFPEGTKWNARKVGGAY